MSQACIRCRKQKRKCDKLVPVCSLCKRLNKSCSYPAPDAVSSHPVAVPDLHDLTPSNIRHTLEAQVSSIIGDGAQLQETAATYFRSVHVWLPIISETAYYSQLSKFRIQPAPSDFSVLTLCMFLVCAMPVDGEVSDQTRSLYTLVKSFVALLEAMGTNSLQLLQARLLLTVFEIGHTFYPAAYVSAGANVRAAVTLGASAASLEDLRTVFPEPWKAEEARRTWRGIVIADRYASLESENEPSALRGRRIDAASGSGNTKRVQNDLFEKLVHASGLLGQVLTHIHENYQLISLPPLNGIETGIEALHILRSLTSTLATFQGESSTLDPLSSSSLAIYRRSAMLEVLEFGSHINLPANEYCTQTSINILASLVHEIGHEAKATVATPTEPATLPVFIIHCIYKAAIVYLRDARLSGGVDPEPSIRPLTDLLRHIGMRWRAASDYALRIEKASRDAGFQNSR
ncbi:hypothetical protein P170DRAFT_508355 [Aspergillus steynii IBT 23096]|uniref:Zn(2)-C6 fungal-type domain-containing protein n=1 Tax=Aspergillus steynii IBT 23096 TaxID=1392250 RepID=A0A2I2GB78_9EURO|nr:uncharacterized protein P170DRAFT_508355 [Aspergillus steynii IBT 23096]PLB50136.1 hypothetical protein P170DRAFT_508355 [Aspergillus steynii IBT 23096]